MRTEEWRASEQRKKKAEMEMRSVPLFYFFKKRGEGGVLRRRTEGGNGKSMNTQMSAAATTAELVLFDSAVSLRALSAFHFTSQFTPSVHTLV